MATMGPRTLAGRVFAWQLCVLVIALAGLGVVLDRAIERDFIDRLTGSLVSEARTVEQALPLDPSALQETVVRLGESGAVRITVIRTDGVVLADSERDPATMENHADRPEVIAALGGRVGTSSRPSRTIGISFRYVALPPQGDRVVRVAVPLTRLERGLARVRLTIGLGVLVAAVAASAGALLASRGVSRPLRLAASSVSRLGEGDLSARVDETQGPAELTVLAQTLNAMAGRLQEQMLTATEERRTRDLILSSMREGVMLVTPDERVAFANDAAERHLGGRPEGLSGVRPAALQDAARRARTDGTPVLVEVETGTPTRWLRAVSVPTGQDDSVLVVVRDVTGAKRLEAVRRDFVANASHELKTPAAAIQAAAETIRTAASEDPEVVPRFAEQLERDAIRLTRIVSDLLDLSRLESGSELTEMVAFDELVREEVTRFKEPAVAASLALSVEVAKVPPVRGSSRDLVLLVRNLVDNAIRYTRAGGRVDVSLTSADGPVRLVVTDTGIGIPARDLPRVFERFFRVDRARSRETGGTGLGLSIVKHVAENHGGSVEVRSELGRGTRFEVLLPVGGAMLPEP